MFARNFLIVTIVLITGYIVSVQAARAEFIVTTTVTLSICGDGVPNPPAETCDTTTNTGEYSLTIAGRNCSPGCKSGYGPYCGDQILQALQGEECDDGNNTSGDRCSAICKVENLASGCCPGPGPGGGAGPFNPGSPIALVRTKVAIYGKAYPEASVHILKDGEAIGVVKADTAANFYFATTDVTAGVATFGFWAEDKRSIKSIAYTITFRVTPNAVTTITGAYLPPTIAMDKRTVKRGELITFSGQSPPEVGVETHVNSDEEIVAKTESDKTGDWQLAFDSTPLADNDFHTAKALFQTGTSTNVIQSTFSELVSFYVGEGTAINTRARSDINNDAKINFTDFSILIFYWGTANTAADINLDGKVNLVDFSLLIFNWTG